MTNLNGFMNYLNISKEKELKLEKESKKNIVFTHNSTSQTIRVDSNIDERLLTKAINNYTEMKKMDLWEAVKVAIKTFDITTYPIEEEVEVSL